MTKEITKIKRDYSKGYMEILNMKTDDFMLEKVVELIQSTGIRNNQTIQIAIDEEGNKTIEMVIVD